MPDRVGAPPGSRYQDQRRYVITASLADLAGPSTGLVRLTPGLDWSGETSYDLSDDGDAAAMYQTVLNQASSAEELNRWLNVDTLLRLWPSLWLPIELRSVWEAAFPDLKSPPQALAG